MKNRIIDAFLYLFVFMVIQFVVNYAVIFGWLLAEGKNLNEGPLIGTQIERYRRHDTVPGEGDNLLAAFVSSDFPVQGQNLILDHLVLGLMMLSRPILCMMAE